MNYTELTAQIKDMLEDQGTTFVAEIPDLVQRAEDDIYRKVQIMDLRKIDTTALTSGSQYYTLPDDFLSAYSLAVIDSSTFYYLEEKEPEFIREAFPVVATSGRPRYYAQLDDTRLILGPTPSSALSKELYYFYKPESIVTADNTWLGDNAPNVLFYGCIVEAYLFLKGEADLMAEYTKKYNEAIATLKILQEGRSRKTTYRAPDMRAPS